MEKEHFLTIEDLKGNITKLQNFMRKKKLDSFYISSKDIFLNEYAPLADCHRYYFTQFTGSTAEIIIPINGKVLLFVDGRYYEQADLETDPHWVEVYKCPLKISLFEGMKEVILERGFKHLGLEGDRIDLSLFKKLSEITEVKSFNNAELESFINFRPLYFDKLIREIPENLTGEATLKKCQRILNEGEAFFITALDSIAWITNLRRFEIPYQSTLRARALATREKVYLLLEYKEGEIENKTLEISLGQFSHLENFFNQITDFNHLKQLSEDSKNGSDFLGLQKIFYSDRTITLSDFLSLKNFFGASKLENKPEGLSPYHALKNAAELKTMQESFERADQAIFETIKWVKEQVKNKVSFSELDFYHKTNEFYKLHGALLQSFKTISAVGANSSIIHFSHPTSDVMIKEDELILLDSGGYFEAGYATDTTRTFLSGGIASKKQKEIYTLVLKSLLNTQRAIFPEGVWGSLIDGLARRPIFGHGLNYNHGTGHGVGINVHEDGFRLGMNSTVPLKEFTVGSIEPGIYIQGFGGVRLENIITVEKDPQFLNMLHFRPLVYIGFDHELIEEGMLNSEEKIWLDEYEKECQLRGRSFKYTQTKT